MPKRGGRGACSGGARPGRVRERRGGRAGARPREATESFRNVCLRWSFTVYSLMKSSAAISELRRPWRTPETTSASRPETPRASRCGRTSSIVGAARSFRRTTLTGGQRGRPVAGDLDDAGLEAAAVGEGDPLGPGRPEGGELHQVRDEGRRAAVAREDGEPFLGLPRQEGVGRLVREEDRPRAVEEDRRLLGRLGEGEEPLPRAPVGGRLRQTRQELAGEGGEKGETRRLGPRPGADAAPEEEEAPFPLPAPGRTRRSGRSRRGWRRRARPEAGRRPESRPDGHPPAKAAAALGAAEDELDGVGRESGLERRHERVEVGVAGRAEGDRVDQEAGHLLTGPAF